MERELTCETFIDCFQRRDWTMDASQGSSMTRPRLVMRTLEQSEAGEEEEEQAVNFHGVLESIPRAEAF